MSSFPGISCSPGLPALWGQRYMSVPLCSVVLGRGLMLSSAFTKLISLGELPGLDHGFCMEMARGLLPLFWVQDCKICLLQSAARVLCKFDAEQTDSSSLPVWDPRGSSPLLVTCCHPKARK